MFLNTKNKKKGFTIVELVIVIAVIAILSAVLIPTFVSLVNKAKKSADMTTVASLNRVLATGEVTSGKPKTYTEMLAIAEEGGFVVEKLSPTSQGYNFVWDKNTNKMYLYDEKGKFVTNQSVKEPKESERGNYWYLAKTAQEATNAGKNVYLSDESAVSVTANAGIEVAGATNVTLETTASGTFDICLNGGNLTVNAPNADVNSYGTKGEVTITAVAKESFHENGKVNGNVILKSGHLDVKSTASVYAVLVTAAQIGDVKITIPSASSLETVVAATSSSVASALKNNTAISVPQSSVINTPVADAVSSLFAGGFGTEEAPYVITSVEDFADVQKMSDDGVFAYYKVNGLTEIDGSHWEAVDLYGSIDFNGLVINNCTDFVLSCIWGSFEDDGMNSVYVKNLTVNSHFVSDEGSAAAIAYFSQVEKITFENLTVHGYVQGFWNTGAYIAYGSNGPDYVVEFTFKNCYSDADVVVTGSSAGAYFGHTYMNGQSTVKIIDCVMLSDVYSSSGVTGCNLIGGAHSEQSWNVTLVNNGVEEVVACTVKYAKEKSHGLNSKTIKGDDLPEKYATFSVKKVSDLVARTTINLVIGPNGNGTTVTGGYYCGTYMTEEAVVDGDNLVSTTIKNFDITSNGNATTETGLSADGKTYNVVNPAYNNVVGGASVIFIQYDAAGNILAITTFKLI